MKKEQNGYIVPAVIVVVILLILGLIFYSLRQNSKPETAESTEVEEVAALSDADFIDALGDAEAVETKVVARGDVNNDGYEDAIVQSMHCGASCGIDMIIVLNEKNSTAKPFSPTDYLGFEPAYKGSGAAKSDVSSVTIKDGIITLIGTALGCPGDYCDDSNLDVVRKVTYRFDGQKIIQLSVEKL